MKVLKLMLLILTVREFRGSSNSAMDEGVAPTGYKKS